MPARNSREAGGGSLVLSLPDTLKAALTSIAANRYRRGRNYWHSATGPTLSRNTVARLKVHGCVNLPYVDGQARIELTYIGEAIADAMKTKRNRSRGAAQ